MKKTTLNLIGEKFGKLTIVSFSRYFGNYTYWNCICQCGKELEVDCKDLLSEKILCCEGCKSPRKAKIQSNMVHPYSNNTTGFPGVYMNKRTNLWAVSISYNKTTFSLCSYEKIEDAIRSRVNAEKIIDKMKSKEPKKVRPPLKPTKDLVGKKFGKLTVTSFSHFKNGYAYWQCVCDCGNETKVYQANLTSGSTSSCGCGRTPNGKKYYDKNLTLYDGVQIEKAAAKVTPKNNTSGFRGVNYVEKTNQWRSRLIFKGVRYELGYYYDIEEAIKARLIAEEMIDGFLEKYYANVQINSQEESNVKKIFKEQIHSYTNI